MSTPRPRLVSWKGIVKTWSVAHTSCSPNMPVEKFRLILGSLKRKLESWSLVEGISRLSLKSYQVKRWYARHLDHGTFWNKKGVLQNFGSWKWYPKCSSPLQHFMFIFRFQFWEKPLRRMELSQILTCTNPATKNIQGTMKISTMTMDLINTVVFAFLPVHKSISRYSDTLGAEGTLLCSGIKGWRTNSPKD